tara:strand:+ start:3362 stop:4252 length:891 start_codon:yes stop_codon:yes gene_type:complete
MIHYIKRKDLDVVKYDACIENSLQSRVYAFSWYLDIVADNWDVLVSGDYEAVMPIPWKQKYFIKYATQPFFCQQLGVFSIEKTSEKLILRFIDTIAKKFKKITFNFNSGNKIATIKTKLRINYILNIENSFEENYQKFNKNRKRSLKKADKNSLTIKDVNFNVLLEIAKKEKKTLDNLAYLKLIKLFSTAKDKEKGFVLGVFNKNEEFFGGAFFLNDNKRITYLFSAMNEEGKNLNAATFLISYVLEKYSNKQYLLDFEGSMNVGIASFFRSFGAKKERYHQIKNNNLFNFLHLKS